MKPHGLAKSILYHLLPGIFILGSILLFSQPIFAKLLGVDEKLSPVVGYLLGILVGLFPVQLGILLISAKRETGTYSINKIIKFTQTSRPWEYLFYVPAFILYFLLLFIAIAPLIQPFIVRTFFSWWPERYNFQLILQNPSTLAGIKGIKLLSILYIVLSCIGGPLVEEIYFRGFLLPRMDTCAGKWAPLLNTVLFSLYHFFSPWENIIRIVASYPLIQLVWKKRDIRYSILVHILVNTLGGIMALTIISNTY